MDVKVGLWRKLSTKELMLLNCGVGEDSWESLGLQGDPTSPFWRRSALGFLWREWCWSWNSNTLATSCEELTHWKRLWCWEGLWAGGEGDDRGWHGGMASLTQWTWVWVNSRSWWWTRRPGVLWFTGLQRVGHDWATELNYMSLVFSFISQNSSACFLQVRPLDTLVHISPSSILPPKFFPSFKVKITQSFIQQFNIPNSSDPNFFFFFLTFLNFHSTFTHSMCKHILYSL